MAVREVSRQSWLSRLFGSVVGVLIGFLLVVGSIIGLAVNEQRAVTTARSLAEGADTVVAADSARIDPALEGRLVHLIGEAASEERLTDPVLGASAVGIALSRDVEMFQWIEDRETETRTVSGGGTETVTTYTYRQGWSDELIDSTRFRDSAAHRNPNRWPLEPAEWRAGRVMLGAVTLPPDAVARISGRETLTPEPAMAARLGQAVGRPAQLRGSEIAVGRNPDMPEIGDLRVRLTLTPNQTISVVAAHSGTGLARFQTRAGDALLLVQPGAVPAADMFATAARNNAILTWVLRGVGLLALFIGLLLIVRPLSVVAAPIPLVNRLVSGGLGLVAFAFTLIVGGIVIALAWLAVRPLIGGAIFLMTVAGIALALAGGRKKAADPIGPPPQTAPDGAQSPPPYRRAPEGHPTRSGPPPPPPPR